MSVGSRFRTRVCAFAFVCMPVLCLAHPVAATRVRGRGRAEVTPLMLKLDTIVSRAIRDGATPGAALAIGHSDDEPEIRTYGRIDWAKGAPAVTENTLYDLASVTKVVATTPAAMLLVQSGELDLDHTVASYLSWWPKDGAKGRITVRQLLLHTSGLPAGNELWRVDGDRDARIRHIADAPLFAKPGQVTEYSDLGMILLGAVIESVTHERLDTFVGGHLFRPLALADTRYLPLNAEDGPPVALDRIAPTEDVGGHRGHLQGDVDDANAWALGGVAGHAGLFSSIRDLAHFSRLILSATEGQSTDVLEARVIRDFAADRPDGRRALGWDGAGSSSWGHYFSPVSFGHNGYTGTSIWIDPERDLYVVLLTNRVDPSARNQKHLALRRDVSAAVRDASPIRLASADEGPGEAGVFAAEVAAARTIFTHPIETIRRAAAHHHAVQRGHTARRRVTHATRAARSRVRLVRAQRERRPTAGAHRPKAGAHRGQTGSSRHAHRSRHRR